MAGRSDHLDLVKPFTEAVEATDHPKGPPNRATVVTSDIMKTFGLPFSPYNVVGTVALTEPSTPFEGYTFDLTTLKNMITNQEYKTRIRPVLISFSGIPKSGKTMAVNHIIERYVDKNPPLTPMRKDSPKPVAVGITYHELVATGFKSMRNLCINEVTKESSFAFGLLSAFKLELVQEKKFPLFNTSFPATEDGFKDRELNTHLQFTYQYLYNQEFFSKGTELTDKQIEDAKYLKQLLPEGIALINIWDIALNKTVLHFLTALKGHLYNNHCWLFLDLERDLDHLDEPPEIKETLQENQGGQVQEDQGDIAQGGQGEGAQCQGGGAQGGQEGEAQGGQGGQAQGGQERGARKAQGGGDHRGQEGRDHGGQSGGAEGQVTGTHGGQREEGQGGEVERDGAVLMKWRPRLHYLLRSCQMSEAKDGVKKRRRVCTIFAKHGGKFNGDLQEKIEKLEDKIQPAARHIGVSSLLEEKVETINLGTTDDTDDNSRRLYQKFQQVICQTQFESVPISWVFLRSLFFCIEKIYISRNELEKMADKCGIKGNAFNDFCKFYTSFGSIIDPSLVSSECQYVIVKPIAFLRKLDTLLYPDKTLSKRYPTIPNGIFPEKACKQVFGEACHVYMNTLTALCLATNVATPYLDIPSENLKENALDRNSMNYYISLSRTTPLITDLDKDSVHSITSIDTPHIFKQVTLTKHLFESLRNPKLVPCPNMNRTIIKDDSTRTTLTIVSHSPATRLHLSKPNLEICSRIVEAYRDIARSCDTITKYKFVMLCVDGSIPNVQSIPSSRYHILPDEKLCDKCREAGKTESELLKMWNEALKKCPIDESSKPTGDLKTSELGCISENIASFNIEAQDLLKLFQVSGHDQFQDYKTVEGNQKPVIADDKIVIEIILAWRKIEYSSGNKEIRSCFARKLSELGSSTGNESECERMAKEIDVYYYKKPQNNNNNNN